MFSNHGTCWDLFAAKKKCLGNIIFTGHKSAIGFLQLPLITFLTFQGKVQTFIRLQNGSLKGLILAKLIKNLRVFQAKKKYQANRRDQNIRTKTSRWSSQNKLPWISEKGRVESWHTTQGTHIGLACIFFNLPSI